MSSAGRSRPLLRRTLALAAALGLLAAGVWLGSRAWDRAAERREALALADKNPTDALPRLIRCLDRAPDDADLLRAVVGAQVRAGAAIPDVEPYTERLCRAAPNDPAAFVTRADALARLGRYAEATATAARAVELAPADELARSLYATLLSTSGRYADAAREYRTLATLNSPREQDYQLNLARAEWELGNRDEALRLVSPVLARTPDHAPALLLRALIHTRDGEDEPAVALLRRVRPADPTEAEHVIYQLALALDRLGRIDEAAKARAEFTAIQEAPRLIREAQERPGDTGLQLRAADSLLVAGRAGEARDLLDGLVSRAGPSRSALDLLARCHDRLGRPDLARAARDRAAKLP